MLLSWISVTTIILRNSELKIVYFNFIKNLKFKFSCVDTCCESNCCEAHVQLYYKSNQFIIDHMNISNKQLTNKVWIHGMNYKLIIINFILSVYVSCQ